MDNAKILIVEDEAITALFVRECLENLGYIVLETAASGYEAIDIAEEYRPNLVLMDIMLDGELNGIETAKIIYERFAIPIVYLTAYSDNNTLEKAKLTGSFGYLLKPVEEKSLYPTIEMALAKHQEESKLKNTNQWLTTMVKNINKAIIAVDNQGLIKFVNSETELISGWQQDNITDKRLEEIFFIKDNQADKTLEEQLIDLQKNLKPDNMLSSAFIITKENDKIPVEFSFSSVTDDAGQIHGFILNFSESNQKYVKKNSDGEVLNKRLKELNNLMGICSFCKKIRDDRGQWSQLETYIQNQFDILFSHGVCPECSRQYYPNYFS